MVLLNNKHKSLSSKKQKKNTGSVSRQDKYNEKKTDLNEDSYSDDEEYFSSTSFIGFSGDELENEKIEDNGHENKEPKEGSGHVLNLKKKLKQKKPSNRKRHIMYIGRLSGQLTEDDLLKYFTQFGRVINIRISRNKKTGNSKHYGFIEFQTNASLTSACLSMNNYLIYGHQLQCQIIDNNNIPENLFMNSNKKFHPMYWQKISKYYNDRKKLADHLLILKKKYLRQKASKKAHLQSKGIFYDFENFV